jgi:hypothetical protein
MGSCKGLHEVKERVKKWTLKDEPPPKKEGQERLDRSWPVLTATFEALPLPVNGCKGTQ